MSLPPPPNLRTAFEDVVQESVDALTSTAQAISDTAHDLANDLAERLGLNNLPDLAGELRDLPDVARAQLAALLSTLEDLKALAGEMTNQADTVRQQVVNEPFAVASRADKVQMVMDLFVKMQRVNTALQDIFRLLKGFVEAIPAEGKRKPLRDILLKALTDNITD